MGYLRSSFSTGSFADEAVMAELSETVDYSAINEEWASMVDCTLCAIRRKLPEDPLE